MVHKAQSGYCFIFVALVAALSYGYYSPPPKLLLQLCIGRVSEDVSATLCAGFLAPAT